MSVDKGRETKSEALRREDQGELFYNAERGWHEDFLQIWMAMGCRQSLDLLEVCAPWDSPLCTSMEAAGGKAMRLGLHNGFDLCTTIGIQNGSQHY